MVDQLVLSLFPGVDLFGRAFEKLGFVVVRGPDLVTGGDVRSFRGIAGRFDGVIAGPPCQGFSVANSKRFEDDHESVQNSRQMMRETVRILEETRPNWFVVENVPSVPDIRVQGYRIQRVPITDLECGGNQLRARHFQVGFADGRTVRVDRPADDAGNRRNWDRRKAITTKTSSSQDFPDICRAQGLAEPLSLPGWSRSAKFKAVGNGVSMRVGEVVAAAILGAFRAREDLGPICRCGCGRPVRRNGQSAGASCRKRVQLGKSPKPWIDSAGYHEP